MARYEVNDILSFVSCKKCIACLTLSGKRTSETAWVVAFLIPAAFFAVGTGLRESGIIVDNR